MAAQDPSPKCIIKIPDGLYRGSKITLQGSIPPDAKRFSINLQCGPSITCLEDIAFHLNPRFDANEVIRNHCAADWGREEKSGGMPLSKDATFEVVIECDVSAYKVSFHGKHFCEFAHRVQYTRVTHLMVDGDVNIRHISF